MRFALIGVITTVLMCSAASAQLSDPPKADECEAYYRFELQVIEEQRYYLTQAAIKAVEAKQPAPDENAHLIEQARAETDQRFQVDYEAAKRSRDRCLMRAKQNNPSSPQGEEGFEAPSTTSHAYTAAANRRPARSWSRVGG